MPGFWLKSLLNQHSQAAVHADATVESWKLGGLQTCLRDTQTGLDAKGVTKQLRLPAILLFQNWSLLFIFFFLLLPSLRVWLPGLLFDHPPSLPFFFFFTSLL
jgi:hypothetical protein